MEWVVFIFVVVYGVYIGIENLSVRVFGGFRDDSPTQPTIGFITDVLFVFGIIYLLALDFHIILRDFVQHTLN